MIIDLRWTYENISNTTGIYKYKKIMWLEPYIKA